MPEQSAGVTTRERVKPYWQSEDGRQVIYNGDCRTILPELAVDTIITDPVWPNSLPNLIGGDRPYELFAEMCVVIPEHTKRLVVQMGCDSDPRFLCGIPQRWPYLRTCWLDYAAPSYKGRILYTGDIAYAFGTPPSSIEGRRVLPGKYTSTRSDKIFERHTGRNRDGRRFNRVPEDDLPHPAPRRRQHVEWLVWVFSDDTDVLCDPFMGSGTLLLAAQRQSRRAIGIEIKQKYCDCAIERLRQGVLL